MLRRLPPLLKLVREGMVRAGLGADVQDAHIQALNTALAAAFSARSAPLSSAHLREVTQRLEALDELLPDMATMELDADTLRDLSGHESENLEVVAEGGTMPTTVTFATDFSIDYHHTFKVLRNLKNGKVYVLHQCGAARRQNPNMQ